jgi:hypothetical protein
MKRASKPICNRSESLRQPIVGVKCLGVLGTRHSEYVNVIESLSPKTRTEAEHSLKFFLG